MTIDLTRIPDTLDAVHAALGTAVLVLLILQVLLLTVTVTALARRREPVAALAQTLPPVAPVPQVAVAKTPAVDAKPAATPAPAPVQVKTETVILKEATPDAALQLLGLLQKEARFIDFAQENVSQYTDADIGAAARVVHEGCRKVLHQHFELAPVREEAEGKRITLAKGFDAGSVRLTGNIVGHAPFTGTLVHRGWKVTDIKLPKITEGHDVAIIAAAEVEL